VGGWWAIARVDVGSGVCGSMTMMGCGMGECARRSARKRPTQPPPEIRIGRVEGDCGVPFDNAPLDAPFEVVPFAVPFDDVAFDLVPFGVPFDTNAFAVPFVTAIFNVGQKLSLYNVSQLQIESCGTRGLSKSRRRFAD
jgi:hypothetical protein